MKISNDLLEQKTGGLGLTVEIDETMFYVRKYHVGRITERNT